MQQAWHDAPEEKFRPTHVRVGWRADRFLVFGELTDEQLFTQETED